jgi:pseudouridine-5'-phosphate glycosidase
VAVIDGRIHVGLTDVQIQELPESGSSRKVGIRDLALAAVQRASGGTTVAATIFAANAAGIRVFATGGIGGVQREYAFDVSADLAALSHTPIIVVCAGAKAILDLRATLERLETLNVPVLGYGTDEFPAFYSRTSGLKAGGRLDSPREVAKYWAAHCALGMRSALLVANPMPEASAIPRSEIEVLIAHASREALEQGIHGQALTPFLLKRLGELSDRRTIEANVAPLVNNARLAAQIAVAVAHQEKRKESPA